MSYELWIVYVGEMFRVESQKVHVVFGDAGGSVCNPPITAHSSLPYPISFPAPLRHCPA